MRTELGSESFGEAFTTGQQLSLDEAFTTILAAAQFTKTSTGSAPNPFTSTTSIPK